MMLELLKKAGLASGLAAIIVLAVTAVPIWYQIETTKTQNARIDALEQTVLTLTAK
jgi:hypothetical protein